MSADKDRGIRREKQKRAKEAKKQLKRDHKAAASKPAVAKPADQPAA